MGGTTVLAEWGAYSSEYQTVYNAMTNKPSAAVATLQDSMVKSLVSAGYWARMDYLLIPATYTNTASEALINWKIPGTHNATNVSATSWTQYHGFTGDGVADYISTNFNLSTDGSNYSLNDASFGIWLGINQVENVTICGAVNSGNRVVLTPRSNVQDMEVEIDINNTDTYTSYYPNSNSLGLFIVSRTSSSAMAVYLNGSSLGSNGSATSGALPNETFTLLTLGGVEANYSTNMLRIFYLMDACANATEADAIYDIFNTYLTALDAL